MNMVLHSKVLQAGRAAGVMSMRCQELLVLNTAGFGQLCSGPSPEHS